MILCNLRFRISVVEIQRVCDKPENPFSHQLKSAVSSVNITLPFARLGRLASRRALGPSDDDKGSGK